ncbi:MAG: diacylglycerol kinase family lipid kinase [Oscillospiraceae bacterium]|nr:diacylglycerol kinase family lipid kinase [Oscillospiraceae bacterium]
MKKLLLILNPNSGKKKANRYLVQILDILNRGGFDVTVYVTASRGDATEVVRRRAGEFDRILCIGGDGTFNEMISGLLPTGLATPISYIPAGSTNDFATSLHLSKNILQAARDIAEGEPHPLDLGRFNDRYFSYIASFGAFTRASYATSQSLKNALGHFAYILAGIKEVASIRSHHMRVTLADGTVYEDDYIFGAVSNSTSVAGILTLAPELVDMNDGLFEVLLVRKPHNPLELSDCVLALTTQDYNTPMLTLCSSSRVEMESREELAWSLDGEEALGGTHTVIENLHSAVDIILNTKNTKKSR